MSDLLREALRDLGEEARPQRTPDELARSSWSIGRRRRLRQRLAVISVCAAVVGVLVAALPLGWPDWTRPVAPADGTAPAAEDVSSYPEYIGSGRPTAVLPARPGPIAGVLQDVSYGDEVTHYAVTSTGVRWRISGGEVAPLLSPVGRLLLTVTGRRNRLVVHDLVDGTTRRVPESGAGSVPDQWAYWAPDEDRHVLSSRARRLLDLRTGRVTTLPTTGITAGLVMGGRAVTVSYTGPGRQPMTDVVAHVVDLATRRVRDVALRPNRPWGDERINAGHATVSPDGSILAIIRPRDPVSRVHQFSLSDGRETISYAVKNARHNAYGFAWIGDQLTLSTGQPTDHSASTVALSPTGPRTLALLNAADESTPPTMTWATAAISGTPHRTLQSTIILWWSTRHHQALTAASVAVAAGVAGVAGVAIFLRRRRHRARSTP